jgi:DNA replication and repair protein RecF
LHLSRLQLASFRNYSSLNLQVPEGRLLFLGGNAQGKSNLLEAVHLLAAGKSSRATADTEVLGWEQQAEAIQPFARLSGAVERQDGDVQIEMLIVGPPKESLGSTQRAGKRFRVNGIPRRAVDFVGQLRAVLFTADDLEIISGGPSLRRQYLDSALSQLDRAYHAALQRYSRIVQQRNATLRRVRENVAAPDELSLWDEGFTREAAVVVAARQRAVQTLSETAVLAHTELAGAANEVLALGYEPALGGDWRALLPSEPTPESVQPLLSAAVAANRRREIAAGVTLTGPHRDDIAITLNGVSAASYGSRAQIRTAALALRLAEARFLMAGSADPPVILLDDIVSELDEQRRRSVIEGVAGFDQVWFTATSGSWLPDDFVASCAVYQVRDGQIHTPAQG